MLILFTSHESGEQALSQTLTNMIKGKACFSLTNINIFYFLLIICLKAFGISVPLKIYVLTQYRNVAGSCVHI